MPAHKKLSQRQFLAFLKAKDACEPAKTYVRRSRTPAKAWINCKNPFWRKWLIEELEGSHGLLGSFIRDMVYVTKDRDEDRKMRRAMDKVPWEIIEYAILRYIENVGL